MRIALKHLPSPAMGADRGRSAMCSTFAPLPSPLMGEGAGGGESSTSSLPSQPSPPAGRKNDLQVEVQIPECIDARHRPRWHHDSGVHLLDDTWAAQLGVQR
jgi:hypothetical protein